MLLRLPSTPFNMKSVPGLGESDWVRSFLFDFLDYSKWCCAGKDYYIVIKLTCTVLKKNEMCRGVEVTPLMLLL